MTEEANHQQDDKSTGGYTVNDVSVDISIDLREKDQSQHYRKALAEKLAQRMREGTLDHMFPCSKTGDATTLRLTLKIVITACSEGNRMGRMCCAELGLGWVKLHMDWSLWKDPNERLTDSKTEKFHDTASIGFEDLCDAEYGEHALEKKATAAADKIGKATKDQLAKI